MICHNICFYGEIWLIIPKLHVSLLPLSNLCIGNLYISGINNVITTCIIDVPT